MSSGAPLAAGTRLGPYEIESRIGAGGMGEVYKARDARLNRLVAIKLLLPDKGANLERRQQFTLEARAASALNHPNIITIYDVGAENGLDYIVMEYVAGKTLSELVPRIGLRLNVALQYAVQIASALTAAHGAGIIHRDLKPANVMVTETGAVKVLDFGLAKSNALTAFGEQNDTLSASAPPPTAEGIIAGTAAYMSPEQAEGKVLDARSDIFSFGTLLYEMLEGANPFRRETTMSTLSSVLRDQPEPLRTKSLDLPPEVDRILSRCLKKDPSRRFQHMADLKVTLEELLEELKAETNSPSRASSPPASRPRRAVPRRPIWAIAASLALVAAAAGAWVLIHPEREPGIRAPEPLAALLGIQEFPSLSPDGKQVAFAAGDDPEHKRIYIKLVGPGNPLRITNGPDEDTQPMWSPEGASIAFIRSSKNGETLMVMPAFGGSERVVSELGIRSLERGAYGRLFGWSRDGKWLIFFSPEGLRAVSVDTGERRALIPNVVDHDDFTSPAVSPDGRTLAMVGRTGRSQLGIFLAPLSSGMKITAAPHNLNVKVQFVENVAWTPDGKELIFSAGPHGYTNLWRVPLAGGDPKQLVAAGLADQATLARDPSGHGMRLVFKRRNRDVNVWQIRMAGGRILGKPVRLIGSTRRDFEPRYSPDGNRIAFSSDRSGSVEVWICDKDGSNAIQMTHFPDGITSGARWSPDSKRLVFLSTVSGQSEIYMMDAQSGPITRLTTDPAHDTAPNWSRDGKWIYFASNRTGMQQIWKMPPEANATPIQVTRHGGIAAIESWDGKTLYYAMQRGGDGIWKVPVEGGEETRVLPTYAGWGNFDVTPKGIVFLPIEPPPGSVWFLPFGGGEPRRMADLERPPDFGLSVSPADGSILYTQVDQDINELAIIENFR